MDTATNSMQSVLVLLASSVLAVAVCRKLKLPAMIGYVATGLAIGPHALGLVSDRDEMRHLAEFGVVFLMFSIGLEFSLAKLMSMRRLVFGLGLAQVGATLGVAVLVALAAGASWQVGVALGGVIAMSSTAIVSRLLPERLEVQTGHGRQVIVVLLGLFLVTVGMMLDVRIAIGHFGLVLVFLAIVAGAKLALIFLLSRAFGASTGTALRVGLALAQAGEFGLVLLSLAGDLVPEAVVQALLAAMILSMLASPFLIAASDRIVMRLSRSEWMLRSLELHRIAVQSIEVESPVIILGYGRNGQRLARLLDAEAGRYIALDLDPDREREAALAGEAVVFADSAAPEAPIAAGIGPSARGGVPLPR